MAEVSAPLADEYDVVVEVEAGQWLFRYSFRHNLPYVESDPKCRRHRHYYRQFHDDDDDWRLILQHLLVNTLVDISNFPDYSSSRFHFSMVHPVH